MSDYVRVYRERFWSLWKAVKKFFKFESPCNGHCRQGRDCDCGPEKNLENRNPHGSPRK